MRSILLRPASCLNGVISLLGDKSIAHRSIILSAISRSKTKIKNFPNNKDCFFTVQALRKLGIKIVFDKKSTSITVFGKGLHGLSKPRGPIFLGESGTTFRLLAGLLAGQKFSSRLTAAKSLSRRPMLRVTHPLRMMGAIIKAKGKRQKAILRLNSGLMASEAKPSKLDEYPPLTIKGSTLKGIAYRMPVASAQVKSAILLAGLYAQGNTQITEPVRTRNHTEYMLKLFKAGIKVKQNKIVIKGNKELVSPGIIYLPADISSASFFIVLTALLPNSQLLIKDISLNPWRLGAICVLKRMGADIQIISHQLPANSQEPMGDILVKSSKLKGVKVKRDQIPSLIDELPILMVAASLAYGKTLFEGAQELRVKETDRISSMSRNLRKMGAKVGVCGYPGREAIKIEGVAELRGRRVKSFGDHRTAMSMIVAGLVARGQTIIDDIACINKSFPDFLAFLKKVAQ